MNSPPSNALYSSGVGSPSASSSEVVAGFFINEAAERERLAKILMRWVPPEYRWMVIELLKRDPAALADIRISEPKKLAA